MSEPQPIHTTGTSQTKPTDTASTSTQLALLLASISKRPQPKVQLALNHLRKHPDYIEIQRISDFVVVSEEAQQLQRQIHRLTQRCETFEQVAELEREMPRLVEELRSLEKKSAYYGIYNSKAFQLHLIPHGEIHGPPDQHTARTRALQAIIQNREKPPHEVLHELIQSGKADNNIREFYWTISKERLQAPRATITNSSPRDVAEKKGWYKYVACVLSAPILYFLPESLHILFALLAIMGGGLAAFYLYDRFDFSGKICMLVIAANVAVAIFYHQISLLVLLMLMAELTEEYIVNQKNGSQ
ncbi:hypothetical protein [Brevibacillus dissolubilis]|uniref:hypothetical protein n=1 Tax=Brevibacillus dissolubilis TaxID=1844116 RepID=UPI001117261F|nr:hypothetical protein [Brevibacillus dissolubilis]